MVLLHYWMYYTISERCMFCLFQIVHPFLEHMLSSFKLIFYLLKTGGAFLMVLKPFWQSKTILIVKHNDVDRQTFIFTFILTGSIFSILAPFRQNHNYGINAPNEKAKKYIVLYHSNNLKLWKINLKLLHMLIARININYIIFIFNIKYSHI